MHAFKDNKGRQWVLTINVAALKRIKALTGLDLLILVADKELDGLNQLVNRDVIQFVDALYVLVKDQADKVGVTDEQFGESLAGDALAEAAEAFVAELFDFFPKAQRETLGKALSKIKEVEARMLVGMQARLDALDVDSLAKSMMPSGNVPVSLP